MTLTMDRNLMSESCPVQQSREKACTIFEEGTEVERKDVVQMKLANSITWI